MRKRIFNVILALCIALSLMPEPVITADAAAASWLYAPVAVGGAASPYFSLGNGTAGAPYEIGIAQELANLSCLINNATPEYAESTVCYKLTGDIELNDWTDSDGDGAVDEDELSNHGGSALPWTPIGKDSSSFAGTFDGGGFTVSGVYIDSIEYHQGLFGYVDGGTVKDVGVIESHIAGTINIGGVAGVNAGGTVKKR